MMLAYVIHLVMFYNPSIPADYTLLASLSTGLTGSWMNLWATASGYLCDISSFKSRTLRLTLLYAIARFGWLGGNVVGGILVKNYSYGFLFTVWELTLTLALFHGVFLMKNVIPPSPDSPIHSTAFSNLANKKVTKCMNLLNLQNFIDSFKIVIKKRKYDARGKIICLIIAMCAPIVAWNGKRYT